MSWIASLARIVGASVPFASSAVQFAAELEAREIQQRLLRLEDPISSLHPDVRELAALIYAQVAESDDSRIALPPEAYERYRRALAMLEQAGHIRGVHSMQSRFIGGLWIDSPAFMMYMCALYEDADFMERLVTHLENRQPNAWLQGAPLAAEFAVPLPVIKSLFQLYENRGLGVLSKELGAVNFYLRD